MKKLLILFMAVFLLFGVAWAEQSHNDVCSNWGLNAMNVMQGRHRGIFVGDLKKKINNVNADTQKISFEIIDLAYSEPLATTEDDMKRQKTEFGNKIYLLCMENKNKFYTSDMKKYYK